LINELGVSVYERQTNLIGGENSLSFSMGNRIENGIYFLKISNDDFIETRRLIISK